MVFVLPWKYREKCEENFRYLLVFICSSHYSVLKVSCYKSAQETLPVVNTFMYKELIF